jgi:hypothetical protein
MFALPRDFAPRVKQSSFESCETQEDACRLPSLRRFHETIVGVTGIFRQPFEHLTELQRHSAPIVACPREARLGDFAYLCNLAGMQSRFG